MKVAKAVILSLIGSASGQVKFMPLGDSITEIACWRAYVWDQLAAEALTDQVDFVGSTNSNSQGCSATAPGFDLDHEGHSGWLSVDIANDYLEEWLASTTPDVVNFMLGTNDVFQGRSTDDVIASYTKMVELMRSSNPSMRIIVDKIIPLSFNQAPIDAINERIPQWAESLSTTESPVVVADCSTDAGFTTGMLRDGVHPNDEGDQLIARQVGPLIVQAIQDVIASG